MSQPAICGFKIPVVGESAFDGRNLTVYLPCTKRVGHHLNNRKRGTVDTTHVFRADWKSDQVRL